MNFVRAATIAAFLTAPFLPSAASTSTINYGRCNPPWKPGKTYDVVSQYEMELQNIVLDIRDFRPEKVYFKGRWFELTRKEKEIWHYTSSPFTGTYSCCLNYTTFATELLNANTGSTFRNYQSAWVGFSPKDEKGMTTLTDANPGWFRRCLGFKPQSTSIPNKKLSDNFETADIPFRDIFEADEKHLDDKSWYFLAWNQQEVFNGDRRHHMDVYKREKPPLHSEKYESERKELSCSTTMARNGFQLEWDRVGDQDIGYNVAQAEAKMMTYAIYGQEKIRNVGNVWTVDPETLESFFPLQSRKRKPFSFKKGNIVLTVKSMDNNGIMAIESLKCGKVNGACVSTDLDIQPNTESEFKPRFNVDMGDTQSNFVRFTIDSRNEICTKAEMQVCLRNYNGALPKVEQLSLEEKNKDRKLRPSIANGEIRLHCMITTMVHDMN